jgi:hypothetical protein
MSTILGALPTTPIASKSLYSSFQDMHFTNHKKFPCKCLLLALYKKPKLFQCAIEPKV